MRWRWNQYLRAFLYSRIRYALKQTWNAVKILPANDFAISFKVIQRATSMSFHHTSNISCIQEAISSDIQNSKCVCLSRPRIILCNKQGIDLRFELQGETAAAHPRSKLRGIHF